MVKRTTSQMHALDIRLVHRTGRLIPGSSGMWTWTKSSGSVSRIGMHAGDGAMTLSYRTQTKTGEWQEMKCQVRVVWTPCNYGGQRAWWVCPGCGTRVAILFGGGRYLCRHCHDLTYKSTRAAPTSAFYGRANKVRMKLGWGGGVASPMGARRKGMHAATYLRLLTELNIHGTAAQGSTDRLVSRLTAKLNAIDANYPTV